MLGSHTQQENQQTILKLGKRTTLIQTKRSPCQPLKLKQTPRRVTWMRNPLQVLKQLKKKMLATLQKGTDKSKPTNLAKKREK